MLPTTILRLLLIFAALLFLVDKAAACSCEGPRMGPGFHPCMTYKTADAIFTGQVTGVSFARVDADGKPIPFSQKIFHFSVDKAIRGVEGPTAEVITNPNTPSCGYPFVEGQRYFVYARRNREGKLEEHLCDPTVPLEKAAVDLAYAEDVMRGVRGAGIVGAVTKVEFRDVKDYGTRSPVSGVEVVLEQQGEVTAKTVTNNEGRYEFREIGEGDYRVRAALPPELRVWSNDGKPKEHNVWLRDDTGCASESFIVINTSSISGRLVTPAGSSLPPQYLALVPLDDKGNEISSSLTPSTGSAPEKGNYYFRDVAPGRYLLAVNARNTPGKSEPVYPLMYYPGVMKIEQATVLQVENSREMKLNDFMLTPPLEKRWFSGTVLFADKTPAAGAKVTLIDPNDLMMGTNVIAVTADGEGKFRVRGYESFPYWIDAYVGEKSGTPPLGIPMFAPPVKLSTSGSVEGIELVISLTYRSQPYHH